MDYGVLLAAGKSSRFSHEIPKQLFSLGGKPLISHSIETLSILDRLLIVTNSDLQEEIKKLAPHAEILINDMDCRIQSIKTAIKHVQHAENVILHDAARPFITTQHIRALLQEVEHVQYCQYYLNLVNGLVKKHGDDFCLAKREQFIELCTPQIIKGDLFAKVFKKINTKRCELLPLAKSLNINYNLIEGHYRYLRKITTLEDAFIIQDS